MFSNGSRSQMGSSRPAASQKRDSRCDGSSAISCSQSMRHCVSSARRQLDASSSARAMVSRVAGRTRRTRSCTPPSSNMRDGAGSRTAARLERAFTTSLGLPSAPGSRSAMAKRGLCRRRLQPVAAEDFHQLGGGAGAGMLIQRLPAGDGQRIGAHGLDPDLEGAGLDGLLDILRDPGLQLGEELVLLVDGERQQPVQEPGHGRQLLLEVALVDELEAGGVLEAGDGPARDAAPPERDVEAPERRLRVGTLQIVALAEQRRIAAAHGGLGIALTPCNRAQGVKPARDRGDEPPLALHIGGDGPEQRRAGLVSAVGPAQPLDGLVGPPARLQQVVDAPLGIGRRRDRRDSCARSRPPSRTPGCASSRP